MLKNLKEILESEKKDRAVFDIIIYGSAAKGKEKPGDIDILVIFLEGSLKERLDKLQKLKSKLKLTADDAVLDLKQIKLEELFSSSFFAKTGILLEGISIFKNKKFSETLGFMPHTLFLYSLKELTHSQKIKFNYILAGRGKKGVIEELNGRRLVNGAVLIPIENSYIFEEILKTNNIKHFSKKNILGEAA